MGGCASSLRQAKLSRTAFYNTNLRTFSDAQAISPVHETHYDQFEL